MVLVAAACGSSRGSSEEDGAGSGGAGTAGNGVQSGDGGLTGGGALGAGSAAGMGTGSAGKAGSASGAAGSASGAAGKTSIVVCPGSDPNLVAHGNCRSGLDCSSQRCVWGTSNQGACGPTGFVGDQCTTDASCSAGRICEVAPYQSCGDVAQCLPRCTAATCDEGQTCDEATGRCEYLPCSDGWTCADDEMCLAIAGDGADGHGCAPLLCELYAGTYACPAGTACSRTAADRHGCQTLCSVYGCDLNAECGPDEICRWKSCGTDGDCDCGVCAMGECHDTLGICDQGTGGTSG